jgi:hypothetical protein
MAVGDSITTGTITTYMQNVHARAQQKVHRLAPWVQNDQFKGKQMAYDGIGSIELGVISGRFAPVEFADIEWNRRKVTKRRFGATLPIDKNDINERLASPDSSYVEQLANAIARKKDKVVVEAMFADVATGEDFENTTTASSDGVLTVDATGGLTYEKLLEIHQNFMDGDVGNDMDASFVLGVTGDEHTDLMSELELTSGDYSRQYVAEKGTIQIAAGINIVKFAANGANGADPILPVSGGVRTSFCMAKGAILLATAIEFNIVIEQRNDKYSTYQIKCEGSLGAVRTEGKLIQKVTTTD